MKRAVADTNILVSALQFGGKPNRLLALAIDGQIDLTLSEAIIAETIRVLRDEFDRDPEWLAEADRQLRVIARIVAPTESIRAVEADPTDDPGCRRHSNSVSGSNSCSFLRESRTTGTALFEPP